MSWHVLKEFGGAVLMGCLAIVVLACLIVATFLLGVSVPLFLVARFARWLTTGPAHRFFEAVEDKWIGCRDSIGEIWDDFFQEVASDWRALKRRMSNAVARLRHSGCV